MKTGDRVVYKADGKTEGNVVHCFEDGRCYVLFDTFVHDENGKPWRLMEVQEGDVTVIRASGKAA